MKIDEFATLDAVRRTPSEARTSHTSHPARPAPRRFVTACILAIALVLGVSTSASAEQDTAGEPIPSDEGTVTPPPGTLGADGIVPASGDADEVGMEPIGHIPGPGEGVYGDPPNSGTGIPADQPWSYDPTYFFALTHGLSTDTDLSQRAIKWVRPLTLTFDVLTLPTAALAGLSGRSPQGDEAHAANTPAAHDTEASEMPQAAPVVAPAG